MNKIFIVGDLHGGEYNKEIKDRDDSKISLKKWPLQKQLDKSDILIQTGDFGYIWYHSEHPKYKKDLSLLKDLANRNFTLAFVDGNHENFDLINVSPIIEKWGGLVNEVYPNIFRLRRGEIYTINGKKILTIGGAMSNPNQKEYNFTGKGIYKKEKKQKSWWAEELLSVKDKKYIMKNLSKHNYEIDVIISHTCPVSVMKEIYHKTGRMDHNRLEDPVSIFLEEINKTTYFKEWHFGHHHQDVELFLENEKFFCHYNKTPHELI